jgi:hypothetical protein
MAKALQRSLPDTDLIIVARENRAAAECAASRTLAHWQDLLRLDPVVIDPKRA